MKKESKAHARVDLVKMMIENLSIDDILIPYGKHKGKKYSELPEDYKSWLLKKMALDQESVEFNFYVLLQYLKELKEKVKKMQNS